MKTHYLVFANCRFPYSMGSLEEAQHLARQLADWDFADIMIYKYEGMVKKKKLPSQWIPASESNLNSPNMGCIDVDGNQYKTVKIGNQVWMAENLKVTHYRNGDAIPNVTPSDEWSKLKTGACCIYDNGPANAETYGLLYNWFVVNDPRGLAPEGWHIPSDEDWQQLVDFLGGLSVAGGKLKETGTSHWRSPNTGETDAFGFCALPGGFLDINYGFFNGLGNLAFFWSSSEYDSDYAWYRHLYYGNSGVYRHYLSKRFGFSVRCIKD